MKMRNPTLKEMLIDDLPAGFVKDLIEGMSVVYPDSHATMINDPEVGTEQAKGALGHLRRARAETLLERLAITYRLNPETIQPEGGGVTHIALHAGRFELVMCHVISRDAFPQHSNDRELSSKANECLAQIDFLSEQVRPEENELYGIIIHSEVAGKKDLLGSIKIGFPNHEWDGWLEEPVDLLEIYEKQGGSARESEDLQGRVQDEKAKPKLKKLDGEEKKIKKGA